MDKDDCTRAPLCMDIMKTVLGSCVQGGTSDVGGFMDYSVLFMCLSRSAPARLRRSKKELHDIIGH